MEPKKIDYAKYFDYAGLIMTDANIGNQNIELGATINDKNIITQVRKNSSAEMGGLNVNDEIISINGFRYANNLATFTTAKKAGDTIDVIISRNGMIKDLKITLAYNDKVNYQLTLNPNASEDQKAVYMKWLNAESFN